jgi:hypothetical protein
MICVADRSPFDPPLNMMGIRSHTMIELNEVQCRELGEAETIAVDPITQREYVLVPKEVYDQLRSADDDAVQMASLLVELDSEDWEDSSAYEGKP